MKNFYFWVFSAVFFFIMPVFGNSAAADSGVPIPVSVTVSPQRDIGIFVAAYLNLPVTGIFEYNQKFIDNAVKAKKIIESNSEISDLVNNISYNLKEYSRIYILIKVPFFFESFDDTIAAYKIILDNQPIDDSNNAVYQKLKKRLFSAYPYLQYLTPDEKKVGRELVEVIKYEYENFYKEHFESNKKEWISKADNFKKDWIEKFDSAVQIINFEEMIKKINIVLSPVLLETNIDYGNITNARDIIALLPTDKEELHESLLETYNELCHQITGRLVHSVIRLKLNYADKGIDWKLLSNTANQAMYEGLKAVKSRELDYFFNSKYGDLTWLSKGDELKNCTEAAGNTLSENEMAKLKNNLALNPRDTSEYIYEKGYLVPKEVLAELQKTIEKNKNRERRIFVNIDAAEAMAKVFLAIKGKENEIKISNLLDDALELKAYQQSEDFYNSERLHEGNRISLVQYKNFILGLARGEILTQNNYYLQNIAPTYIDIINNPGKYVKVIRDFKKIPDGFYLKALSRILSWLKHDPLDMPKIFVWIYFDMKGTQNVFGNDIYINVPSFMNEKGGFNKEAFFHSICAKFYFVVAKDPLYISFRKKIGYDALPDTSKLKMFYWYAKNMMTGGLFERYCDNLPGILSPSFYSDEKVFWKDQADKETWDYFQKNSLEIFDKAREDLKKILDGKVKNMDILKREYRKYWNSYSGQYKPGSFFTAGRNTYLGAEMIGVIHEAFGDEGIAQVVDNPLNLVLFFNKALLKLKPKGYEKYLFSGDIIDKIKEDFKNYMFDSKGSI